MGLNIRVTGDFSQVDTRIIEEYVKAMVQEATGEPVARVTQHGVVKQDIDRLREQFQLTREQNRR